MRRTPSMGVPSRVRVPLAATPLRHPPNSSPYAVLLLVDRKVRPVARLSPSRRFHFSFGPHNEPAHPVPSTEALFSKGSRVTSTDGLPVATFPFPKRHRSPPLIFFHSTAAAPPLRRCSLLPLSASPFQRTKAQVIHATGGHPSRQGAYGRYACRAFRSSSQDSRGLPLGRQSGLTQVGGRVV